MLTVVAGSAEHCCCMFLLLNTVAAAGAEHRGAESVSNKIRIVHKIPTFKNKAQCGIRGIRSLSTITKFSNKKKEPISSPV